MSRSGRGRDPPEAIEVLQAAEEEREPQREPAPVPEPSEVEVPARLAQEIRRAMKRYPQKRSATIPALWAVQRRYGWCSPEGIREAAAVMGVTPGYLESVASFYDLFRLEPQGEHQVLVCTNICCWLRGAGPLLEAFKEAGDERPRRHAGASEATTLRPRIRVPRRLRHRTDGLDRRALLRPARGGRRGDAIEQLRGRRRCCRRSAPGPRRRGRAASVRRQADRHPTVTGGRPSREELMPPLQAEETRLLFRNIDEPGLASIRTYRGSAATSRSARPTRR